MASPSNWERIRELFHTALERAPDERGAFLRAEEHDEAIIREVDSLLAAHAAADAELEAHGRDGTDATPRKAPPAARADAPTLKSGTRLGPYIVASPLGAGAMGEVYRARDTNLRRDVALKILPESFAADSDRLARFTREARALGALNHPHIAQVYGFEAHHGVRALVMELVEGENLAQRIARGRMPVREALDIARQIAEALAAAHARSIVHRDLKPANIMIRADGAVKVLDFGLAKALLDEVGPGATGAEALGGSPTMTAGPIATEVGMLVGTGAYMSPEQARGGPVDRASDIWAFGCVLYEMLTATRAFAGVGMPDTLAHVLTRDPAWERLPEATPPAIRVLLRRCLRKDRRERLQDAAGVRIELEDALRAESDGGKGEGPGDRAGGDRRPRAWTFGVALLAGALLAGVGVWQLKPAPPASTAPAVTRATVATPAGEELYLPSRGMALSPDGAYLAYVTIRQGMQRLYLRPLNRLEATALPGTEGAVAPFFSPDSRWLGFFADGKLKKMPVAGGAPQEICAALAGYGATWGADGVVYFSPGSFNGIWQVPAAGGTPQPFTTLQPGEITHRWPQVLPGGAAVLFTARTGPGADERQVLAQRVADGTRVMLARGDGGTYLPTGHLAYVQAATGTLVGVPFDATNLEVAPTPPVALATGILPGGEGAHYAVSDTGLLAYVTGRSDFDTATLVWVDRTGKVDAVVATGHPYDLPRLSPDGARVAFMRPGPRFEVWVHDIARGDATRLISDGSDQYPIWTRDGSRLTYRGNRAGTRNLFWRMADGSGVEERLTSGLSIDTPGSWSVDGQTLLYTTATADGDIVALRMADRTTQPFVRTRFWEATPQFSPDGRWVAYRSDESGRSEVYVRPYPGPGAKWQISTEGGSEPVWARSGRELFYRNGNAMMSVTIGAPPTFSAGRPTRLFDGDYVTASSVAYPNYDVSPDGRRFLMVQRDPRRPDAPTQIVVVANWFEDVKRLVRPD